MPLHLNLDTNEEREVVSSISNFSDFIISNSQEPKNDDRQSLPLSEGQEREDYLNPKVESPTSQDARLNPDPSSADIVQPKEHVRGTETALTDSDTLTERIGIRFDGPEVSGEPVLFHKEDGQPLAYSSDPPHIRLFGWVLMNVSHVMPGPLDVPQIAKDCQLTASEVRDALTQLVREGDLVRTVERKRELFRLQIKY